MVAGMLRLVCVRGTQRDSILLHLGVRTVGGVLKVQPVKYRHPLAKTGNIHTDWDPFEPQRTGEENRIESGRRI